MKPSLGELLPPRCEWEWGDPREPSAALFPEEEACIARAVDKRRREYAKTRECARLALARLGYGAAPLLNGADREPLWPAGAVGSVTHTDSFCAVAVARESDCKSLGIDAEPAQSLDRAIADRICTRVERSWLEQYPDRAGMLARLVFCAKEAIYKCQFPLSRQFLGFSDVVITIHHAETLSGPFEATLQVSAGPFAKGHALRGRWALGDGLMLASAWIDPE